MIEKYLEYDAIGLIPGPSESEEDFLKRVDYCFHLKEHLQEVLPFTEEDKGASDSFSELFPETEKWMGIRPDWVPLFYSNYKLAPWHGGTAWIFQISPDRPVSAFLQLRRAFKNRSSYFGYGRKEILVHEVSHAGRMMFEEPEFEEILAYRSSPSKLRRFFGALLKSRLEGMFLMILFTMVLFIDFAALYFGQGFQAAIGLKVVCLFILFLMLFRLISRQRSLSRCERNVSSLVKNVYAFTYRLTDKEIRDFSCMTQEEICAYADAQSKTEFRWALLKNRDFS